MSLTDTARHWLSGCALATAASKSDVNVAIPHLRGKWSPTKAILRILDVSFMCPFRLNSSRPDAAILRLPHRVLHLLSDVVEFDPRQPLCIRSLSDGAPHGRRHAAQVVNVRKQRCAPLAQRHQAGDGARGCDEHPVADCA